MKNPLVDDHSEIDALLKELFAAFDKGDTEDIYQKLDFFWARLAMHIRAEHLHLFPALLRAFESQKVSKKSSLTLETVQSGIARLKSDHDFFMRELAAAVKQIRELRKIEQAERSRRLSSARQKIVDVRKRLEIHNEMEESEVYRWTDALINAAERTNLNEQMRRELENLPPRFGKQNAGDS